MHCPVFESAVAKVLGNNLKLSKDEAKAVVRFRINLPSSAEFDGNNDNIDGIDFADSVLSNAEISRSESTAIRIPYRSLKHVSATSNVCERFFSRAKLIARDH